MCLSYKSSQLIRNWTYFASVSRQSVSLSSINIFSSNNWLILAGGRTLSYGYVSDYICIGLFKPARDHGTHNITRKKSLRNLKNQKLTSSSANTNCCYYLSLRFKMVDLQNHSQLLQGSDQISLRNSAVFQLMQPQSTRHACMDVKELFQWEIWLHQWFQPRKKLFIIIFLCFCSRTATMRWPIR